MKRRALFTPPLRSDNAAIAAMAPITLDELNLLSQARKVGLTLEECRELVALFNDPARHSADVKACTLQKADGIDAHIEELHAMRARLLALAEACLGDEGAECPIINHLAGCCHLDD